MALFFARPFSQLFSSIRWWQRSPLAATDEIIGGRMRNRWHVSITVVGCSRAIHFRLDFTVSIAFRGHAYRELFNICFDQGHTCSFFFVAFGYHTIVCISSFIRNGDCRRSYMVWIIMVRICCIQVIERSCDCILSLTMVRFIKVGRRLTVTR